MPPPLSLSRTLNTDLHPDNSGLITACLRLYYILKFRTGTDLTFILTYTMKWTVIEPAAYFMCAAMPDMRPLFQNLRRNSRKTIMMPSDWRKTPTGDTTLASSSGYPSRMNSNSSSLRKDSFPTKY